MRQIVLPGTSLASEEEFLPGQNSFVGPDGNIYSDCIGVKNFNAEEKTASVSKKTRQIRLISPSITVFGIVSFVKEQSAIIDLIEAFDESDKNAKIVFGNTSGVLPVFNASRGFVRSLNDLFKIGDIVKAKVQNASDSGIDLETASNESLGVIVAFCTNCRQQLRLVDSFLKCSSCGSNEKRKISIDYYLT